MIYSFTQSQFSDLNDILYNAAVRAGAQVIFNTNVCSASPPSKSGRGPTAHTSRERPSVQLSDGTVLEADLIIGADGQHSTVRSSVLGKPVEPKRTGTIVLSGNLPMSKVLEDDVTSSLAHSRTYWMGTRRCFLGKSSPLIGCRLLFISPFRLSYCESQKACKLGN